MGQKYWFRPTVECDAISATANALGFTPLVAVAPAEERGQKRIG